MMIVYELKLQRGSPICVGNIPIFPITIGQISDLEGEENTYYRYLNLITIDKERVGLSDEAVSNFELICSFYLHNEDMDIGDGKKKSFRELYNEAMKLFLHEKIEFMIEDQFACIVVGDIENGRIISNVNYDRIIHIIKLQNCIIRHKDEVEEDNPASEKARQLLEKRKKVRELLAKAKKRDIEDSEPLTLGDLVSILCANGNNINPFNVWDLCFYMFNNQFNRMQMLEQYDINIRQLLAGAKPEQIELKHWMTPIK